MGKCLVTKFNSSVQNDNLLKVSEFLIHYDYVNNLVAIPLSISSRVDTTLKIIGNSYFTDIDGNSNKGKVLTISANVETLIYMSNATFDLCINNKYSIYKFSDKYASINAFSCDLSAFKYSKGLVELVLQNSLVYGDLDSIANLISLNILYLYNCNNVVGDTSTISSLVNLKRFNIGNSKNIKSKLEDFSSIKNMIEIRGANIQGSLDSLRNLNSLEQLNVGYNTTGDLAKVPNSVYYITKVSHPKIME